jgi:hypothetical protein
MIQSNKNIWSLLMASNCKLISLRFYSCDSDPRSQDYQANLEMRYNLNTEEVIPEEDGET